MFPVTKVNILRFGSVGAHRRDIDGRRRRVGRKAILKYIHTYFVRA